MTAEAGKQDAAVLEENLFEQCPTYKPAKAAPLRPGRWRNITVSCGPLSSPLFPG